MNYFLINDGFLIIKNHYFPWKAKKIDLQDLDSLAIERPYRRATGLRILFRNFKSKFFGAGSLSKEIWQELINDLELIGIPVRDNR